ncbi:hypothetical protein PISL3812_00754 [Talaromyces islandicus]|uniref:endo-1,3(4)-beta-glucanase n=1 Tax=Talaromyces islandicus TaxID=28573 RepID=A0A0U1LK96_TALIS|nr:hypothetical protein PISL3812_00754 [Talaromyces islandicus]
MASFLGLPVELRCMIYEYLLLDDKIIDPIYKNITCNPSVSILSTNRKIHREASSVLYSRNSFNFSFHELPEVRLWIDKIGHQNAEHIRSISITFPGTDIGGSQLQDNDHDAQVFEIVGRDLPNLARLEMWASDCPSASPRGYRNTAQGLSRMQDRFRGISSLQEIIVRIYGIPFSDSLTAQMESYEWTLEIKPAWHDDRSLSEDNHYHRARYWFLADEIGLDPVESINAWDDAFASRLTGVVITSTGFDVPVSLFCQIAGALHTRIIMPWSLVSGTLALALAVSPAAATPYSLLHHFDASNFFQNFSLTTGTDPTHGFVDYVDYDTAHSSGLAAIKSGNVYLGVDHTNTYSSGGRPSTRVESNVYFDHGLLVADFAHMPAQACGVWPAFWTVGKSWPADGEIDIIEGVNRQANNQMALHTEGDCQITSKDQTGSTTAGQCALSTGTSGCEIQGTKGSYGDAFNAGGGGVYAIEWTSKFIKIWSFPRDSIPASITAGKPDSAEFGTPMGNFQGSCNVGDEFQAQRIIINTDFCGDWAGGVFGSSGCPLSDKSDGAASCQAYVGSNPAAFVDAYWEIKSIQIYEQGTSSPTSTVQPTTTKPGKTHTTKPHTTKTHTAVTTTPDSTTTTTLHSTSTSTKTVFRSQPSSSPVQKPSTTPCPKAKSTVTVTSFTTPPPLPSSIEASATHSSKLTTTTIVTTSFVDVCPSGYTTKTVTHTVTYCPADATSGGVPPGFTTTAKPCPSGCGSGPTTVVVTVPTGTVTVTESGTEPASVPTVPVSVPAAAPTSVVPSVPPPVPTSIVSVPVPVPTSVSPTSVAPAPQAPPASSQAVPPPAHTPSSVAIPPVVTPTTRPASTTTGVSPAFTNTAHTNKPFSFALGLWAVAVVAVI